MLTIELVQSHGAAHNLGHFRISATASPQPVRASQGIPKEILAILAVAAPSRSAEQQTNVGGPLPLDRAAAGISAQAVGRRRNGQGRIRQNGAHDAGLDVGRAAHDARSCRAATGCRTQAAKSSTPRCRPSCRRLRVRDRRATRLDLARWIVSPDNPLAARVFVNRLWKLVFGQGIVKTLDDFGSQGAAPTHPELLDWLAVEFIDSGWDVKHVLKLIVMSATYRQSSAAGESLRQADPYNKWLARQSRFRLDAEMVRDNALAVSGLLVAQDRRSERQAVSAAPATGRT